MESKKGFSVLELLLHVCGAGSNYSTLSENWCRWQTIAEAKSLTRKDDTSKQRKDGIQSTHGRVGLRYKRISIIRMDRVYRFKCKLVDDLASL